MDADTPQRNLRSQDTRLSARTVVPSTCSDKDAEWLSVNLGRINRSNPEQDQGDRLAQELRLEVFQGIVKRLAPSSATNREILC